MKPDPGKSPLTDPRQVAPATDAAPADSNVPRLSLFDAVSIMIGIVVGVSIFKVPGLICSNVAGVGEMVAAWTLGGVLSLIGAMCYAELATTYPRTGGDYVYLTRAFGPLMGFLFGWAQLTVILTGSIGAMGFAFADYLLPIFHIEDRLAAAFAIAALIILTTVNILGAVVGKTLQNVLTVCKVVGLLGILVAGVMAGGSPAIGVAVSKEMNFGLAMIFVLYAYGGWNDTAFVAAEVRDLRRNVPRALILGIGAITLLYILINLAYVWGLGFEAVSKSFAPAADLLSLRLGKHAGNAISVLVMISALGAMNGLIFTGSRVISAIGADHPLFRILGRWHHGLAAPIWSLIAQAVVTVGLILAVGTDIGREKVDLVMNSIHIRSIRLGPLPWDEYFGGFNLLVAATAPVFWLFFLLTGLSLFVLRYRNPEVERPFSAPLYPVTPIVFCLTSVYMLYSSIMYAKALSLLGILPLLAGIPLYFVSRSMRKTDPA